MLIIPELETVIITPPRTGSTSLRESVLRQYKHAFAPYRHMEAVGIPYGYTHFKKLLVIREPYARMWSMFRWLELTDRGHPDWRAMMHADIAEGFEHWLLNAQYPFTFNRQPRHTTMSSMPEPMKSQAVYGRRVVVRVCRMETHWIEDNLNLGRARMNESDGTPMPELADETRAILDKRWAWELQFYRKEANDDCGDKGEGI